MLPSFDLLSIKTLQPFMSHSLLFTWTPTRPSPLATTSVFTGHIKLYALFSALFIACNAPYNSQEG
jgi:hypothetical protein